jgi:hypothetical protein
LDAIIVSLIYPRIRDNFCPLIDVWVVSVKWLWRWEIHYLLG